MTSRRPALVLGLLLALLPAAGWTQTASEAGFEVGSGFLWGTTTELVLRDGTYHRPLSRLTWPTEGVAVLSAGVWWPWSPWTSTSLSLRMGRSVVARTIVDEDWDVATDSGTMDYGRSEHEADVTAHGTVRAEQTWGSPEVSLLVGGQYRWVSWEAWNGHGGYDYEDDSADTDVTFTGLLLAYRQQWLAPYLGIGATWSFGAWTLSPELRLGPYSWCFDMDNHLYAGRASATFLDSLRGGAWAQTSWEAAFELPGGRSWGVRLEGELNWGAIGDTVVVVSKKTSWVYPTSRRSAGAWYYEGGLTLFLRP